MSRPSQDSGACDMGLPEELREILLAYITPLHKAIAVLLSQQTRDKKEFESNFKNVMNECMKYHTLLAVDVKEDELALLLQKSLSSPPPPPSTPAPGVGLATQGQAKVQVDAETLAIIEQTLNNAHGAAATATRLMLQPACQAHVVNHPGGWEPYKELMAYSMVLDYILQQQEQVETVGILQSMVETIVRKCQETTSKVEDLVDRISREIVLDPELTAALERFAYSGEKMA